MFTKRILPSCPTPGEGVQAWIMRAAWAAKTLGLPVESAVMAIRSAITRSPLRNEIEQAVRKVFAAFPAAKSSKASAIHGNPSESRETYEGKAVR